MPTASHAGTAGPASALSERLPRAVAIYRKVKDLESVWACLVEMEPVPVEVADFVTRNTSLMTEGMGCGSVCDTRCLFSLDVPGTNRGHDPRHSKTYADLAAWEDRLQAMCIKAFRGFMTDVESGGYPGPRHGIHISGESVPEALARAGLS